MGYKDFFFSTSLLFINVGRDILLPEKTEFQAMECMKKIVMCSSECTILLFQGIKYLIEKCKKMHIVLLNALCVYNFQNENSYLYIKNKNKEDPTFHKSLGTKTSGISKTLWHHCLNVDYEFFKAKPRLWVF